MLLDVLWCLAPPHLDSEILMPSSLSALFIMIFPPCSLDLSQASVLMNLRVNFAPVEKRNLLWTVLPSVRSIYKSFDFAALNPSVLQQL